VALLRIITAVGVAGFVSAAPAAAAPNSTGPAATRLSISVSDGVSQVADRTSVSYVATVVNDGADTVEGRLVLEVPAFVHYGRARAAKVTKQVASWAVRVPPNSKVTRRLAARIGTIPSAQLRVTSLASLFLGPVTAAPAIRAADSDRIAGVVDPPGTRVPKPTTHTRAVAPTGHDDSSTLPVAGLVFLGAAGLAGFAAVVRWRRRATSSLTAGDVRRTDSP
jgi:hypothetical protein